jgi:hypothetical protein
MRCSWNRRAGPRSGPPRLRSDGQARFQRIVGLGSHVANAQVNLGSPTPAIGAGAQHRAHPGTEPVTGSLTVRRALLRPKWRHGCDGKCEQKTPGQCPDRVNTRPVAADTKSRAGRRSIGLPDALVTLLREHQKAQAAERDTAAQLWRDEGWVFASPIGEVINQATDYDEWKRLLKLAGVRDGRLHDARHTAATVLLVLGVSGRAVMGIMGGRIPPWPSATST